MTLARPRAVVKTLVCLPFEHALSFLPYGPADLPIFPLMVLASEVNIEPVFRVIVPILPHWHKLRLEEHVVNLLENKRLLGVGVPLALEFPKL